EFPGSLEERRHSFELFLGLDCLVVFGFGWCRRFEGSRFQRTGFVRKHTVARAYRQVAGGGSCRWGAGLDAGLALGGAVRFRKKVLRMPWCSGRGRLAESQTYPRLK